MVKPLRLNDLTYYKNYKSWLMKMPQQIAKRQKNNMTNKAMPHPFNKVLIANNFDTTKKPKLVPNWKGPGKIIDINDTNAKIKFKNKIKVLNVAKLKHFYENVEKSIEKEGDANQFNQNFNQSNEKALTDFNDIFNKENPSPGPKQN